MDRAEVLEKLSSLARHADTQRLQLDATHLLGKVYSLFSETLNINERRQQEKAELDELMGRVADRLNRELHGNNGDLFPPNGITDADH